MSPVRPFRQALRRRLAPVRDEGPGLFRCLRRPVRPSHISRIVAPATKVPDLGCGNGDLVYPPVREKNARVRGREPDEAAICGCARKKLSVIHGDIGEDLREYPDGFLDDVILNRRMIIAFQTLLFSKRDGCSFPGGNPPVTRSLPCGWSARYAPCSFSECDLFPAIP